MTGETRYSGSMSNESKYNGSITGDVKNNFDYFLSVKVLDELPLTLDSYTLMQGSSIIINDIKYG